VQLLAAYSVAFCSRLIGAGDPRVVYPLRRVYLEGAQAGPGPEGKQREEAVEGGWVDEGELAAVETAGMQNE
jgi:hypothetical protein